jgi:hypothetical protein
MAGDTMSLKDDMMDKFLNTMPKEEKQKMMLEAMTKMMAEMTAGEKQRIIKEMMGQFFISMSEDDRGDMMKSFMPEMMKNMMGGGMMSMMSQMTGGDKEERGMMNMMRKCMSGEFEPPWKTMQSIMEQVLETCGFALVHTPELHSLFSEFIHKKQEEVLSQISGRLTLDNLKEKTGLKNESLIYIVLQLALLDEVELTVERKRKSSHNP